MNRDIDPQYHATIPTALSSWYASMGGVKLRNNQGDITAPLITSTEDLLLIITGDFNYEVTVVENSFAVNSAGSGMSVILSGSPICANLSTSIEITGNNTTVNIPISPSVTGLYQNCTIQIVDHAGNISLAHTIDEFVYGSELIDMCLHSSFSIPQIECEALVKIYESTNGAGWQNKTNWLQSTDVETWFGVSTSLFS